MNRRKFLRTVRTVTLGVCLNPLGCLHAKQKDVATPEHEAPSGRGSIMSLKENLARTEKCLEAYPYAAKRLDAYLEELGARLESPCAPEWLAYQAYRLDRIRWLVDTKDSGRKSGMRLRMRPYDIPWAIWCVGLLDDPDQAETYTKTAFNGVIENTEKILDCPDLEIEFTDELADFCYLCENMTADGCPKFEGYRDSFPQSSQMSAALRKDSDVALEILGLKWSDKVTARELLRRCVTKAAEPSDIDVFPLEQQEWEYYRKGIAAAKGRRER